MAFAQRIITSNSAGDQEFTFTFDYIKEEHIKVFVNFVEVNQGTGSNEFQVITNTTPKKISLNTGLASNNTRVEIRRISSLSTPLVDFADGSTLTAADLDTAEKQSLFIDQELDDAIKQGVSIDPTTGLPSLSNQRLTNVTDPVNAQDAVTKAYLERSGSITSTQILNGTIVDADINASAAIAGSKLQASSGSNAGSMSAANFTKLAGIESGATADQTDAEIRAAVEAASDSNVFTDADHTKLNNIEANATADQTNAEIRAAVEAASDSNVFTDADHTKLNNIEANATADQTVTEIKSLIAGSPLDASHLASNSVTTSQIADTELTTLAGMQAGTASKLADSTALTADIADLNQLDGMAKETSVTNSNTRFPTSAAVVNFVANQIAPVGGLEVIADEDSFPATQPVSGVVISISNADGLVVNNAGEASNARTVGSGTDNVTIKNFPTSLRNKTLANELGLLVSSTGASQEYNYHKLLAKETDVLQLSDDINDFNNRYRVVDTNPTSDNDAGDLIFNRSTQKLLVYNSTSGAFEEAQSVGNFFIATLSPAFNGSLQDFTITNAPTNAQQIILSIGGVIQKPNSGTSTPSEGFALSGNTIKLAAPPPSGTDYFAIVLGSTVNIGTPSNDTVSSAILQSGSVIEAKLGSGAVTRTKLNLVSTSSAPGLEIKGDGSSDGYLQLNCSQNSHGVKLKSPPHSANQNYTLTLPSALPSSNGFLVSDSNGNTSFTSEVSLIGNELRVHDLYLARDISNNDPIIQPAAQANITLRCGPTTSGAYTSILDNSGLQLGRNTQYVKLKAPADQTGQSSYDFTFPISGGSNGQFLKTDGNGTTSWDTVDLTSLSASNLTSGTVPDARFPATLPAISGANLTNLPASGKVTNLALNGAMQVAQRGVSHTSSGYRTIDRFKMSAGNASATLTQAQVDITAGAVDPRHYGFYKCFKITNNGQSANNQGYCYIEQSIEGQNIVQSGWRFNSNTSYITVSFWVRTSVAQNYLFSVYTHGGTAKEYNWIESLSANVWTKITKTIPGDSSLSIPNTTSFGLSIYFHAYLGDHYTSGSTVNQWVTHAGYTSRPDMDSTWWTTGNSTYELTGVLIEAGNSASPFPHESYQETLLKCKRYCHVIASANYHFLGLGMQYYSGTIFIDGGTIDMRDTPTMVAKSGGSGAYVYEKLFGNSAQYHHQIALDGKTTKHHAVLSMSGDNNRHGQVVRCSAHSITLSNNEPFVYLDAEL